MAGLSSDAAIGQGGRPPRPVFVPGGAWNQTRQTPKARAAPMTAATPGMGGVPAMHQPEKHGRIQCHEGDDGILRSVGKGARQIPRGRDREAEDKEKNVTPFHARSSLRNPSLPARIIEAGATPPGEGGPKTPVM